MRKKGFLFSNAMLLLLLSRAWIGSTEAAGKSGRKEAPELSSQAIRAEGKRLFVEQIRPLLRERCLGCHGSESRQSGLDLSTDQGILKGGRRGTIVVPGKVKESSLYLQVAHLQKPHMPFLTAKLPKEMIALLAFWIGVGAPLADAGTSEKPKSAPAGLDQEPTNADFPTAKQMSEKSPSSGADRKHWAFQPPQQLEIPQVKDPGWVRNPIDAFIASDHDRLDLEPMPRAKKRVLLRRVYLDLIGLPPTPAQLRSFLEDLSPNAYDKVVMDLLSSPQYGERWGRHCMDVWRYSDWYGYKTEVRYSQRHIWRWRDWIVESLNQDKGYDRMIVEILA